MPVCNPIAGGTVTVADVVTALNLVDFGADPTGATTSDAAAAAARAEIMSTRVADEDAGAGFYRCTKWLWIPPGRYLFESDEALMGDTGDARGVGTFGYTVLGAGEATRLVYAPTATGRLFRNNNQYLNPKTGKFMLVGQNANAIAAESLSSAVAQGWTWPDTVWWGTWGECLKKGAYTIGVATISNASPALVTLNNHGLAAGNAVSFTTTGALPSPLAPNTTYHTISAGLTANTFEISATPGGAAIATTDAGSGIHTAYTANGNDTWRLLNPRVENVTVASGAFLHEGTIPGMAGQDQSIANVITNPNVFLTQGDFLNLNYGGDYLIEGGSIILKNGNVNSAAFRLDARPAGSGTPFLGVCKFENRGTRFEIHETTAQIMTAAWPYGTILFDSISDDGFGVPTSQVLASYDSARECGPLVEYRNCTLTGRHQFTSNDNAALGGPARAVYRRCQIYSHLDLQDFALYNVLDTGQLGGAWQVDFEDCRPGFTYNNNAAGRGGDVSPGWYNRLAGEVRAKVRAITTAYGTLPFAPGGGIQTASTVLPRNATVTKVRFYSPNIPGASAVTGWSYTLTNGNGVTICTFAPGTAWYLGFSEVFDVYVPLTTAGDQTLTLTSNVINQGHVESQCLVEYLPGW